MHLSEFDTVVCREEFARVASLEQCREIIISLADQLNAADVEARRKHIPDRTLELTLSDLGASFHGRLTDGELVDIREATSGKKPHIKLMMRSDDLLLMTEGELHFAHAWATGRVRLDAGFRDLLRLRKLL